MPLFALAHFCHHIFTSLPIPLLPMIRNEFGLDYTQSGLVITAFGISYGISQLPGGWLTDHIGARTMITVAICGVALAGLFVGLSHTYTMMMIFLVLMGFMGGGYHPAASPTVSSLVDSDNRGTALGIHLIGGSACLFVVPLIISWMPEGWGWRESFISLAIPVIAFGIIFYFILGRIADRKKTMSVSSDPVDKTSLDPGNKRRLISFMTLSTFTQAVNFAIVSFIPLFIVDQFGVDAKIAARYISLVYIAGLWVAPLAGYISDRIGTVVVLITVSLLAGPVIYLLNIPSTEFGIGAVLVTIGILTNTRMPVSESYIFAHTPSHNRSTIMGIYFFLSMEAGSIFSPIIGLLIDYQGFYFGFSMAAAAIVLVTIVCAFLLRGSRY